MISSRSAFGLTFLLVWVGSSLAQHSDDRFSALQKKFGVEFSTVNIPVSTWGDSVQWRALEDTDSPALKRFAGLFSQEFSKYPVSFIKRSNLKLVVFVKKLTVFSQKRSAMPDYFKEVLYMDIYVGDYDSTYQKHIIHHEFYHMVEQEFNGNAYYKDPAWSTLNAPGFQYGTGGKNARGSSMYPLTHPEAGFINLYSASGLEEDKAELYASLFIPEEASRVDGWAKDDFILRKKVGFLKAFLQEKGGGDFDDAFWISISR
jgi:hypothetical protein